MRWLMITLCMLATLLAGCQDTRYIHVGANWEALKNLKPSERSFEVQVTGKDRFQLGDALSYTVVSWQTGRLWVVQVDPDDEVTLLFPNDHESANDIDAGRPIHVPPRDASWSIEADKPLGTSVVAFIVTTGDTSLEEVLGDGDSMGKALRLVEKSPAWGLATKIIEVVEANR